MLKKAILPSVLLLVLFPAFENGKDRFTGILYLDILVQLSNINLDITRLSQVPKRQNFEVWKLKFAIRCDDAGIIMIHYLFIHLFQG